LHGKVDSNKLTIYLKKSKIINVKLKVMINKNPNKDQINKTLNDPIKQRIIRRLRANGRSNFGSIIKDLSLSTKNGVMHIVELKTMGIISYMKNSSSIELNEEQLESINED
jgi:DNA-binding transcriptional ArsR family regulator